MINNVNMCIYTKTYKDDIGWGFKAPSYILYGKRSRNHIEFYLYEFYNNFKY